MQIKLARTCDKKEQQQGAKRNAELDRMDKDDLEDLRKDY